MMKLLLSLSFFILTNSISANNSITGTVKEKNSGGPVIGASVSIPELKKGTFTDKAGMFRIHDLPSGSFELKASSVGYEAHTQIIRINTDGGTSDIGDIYLESKDINSEEIKIEATRTNSRIEDSPVKVEVLGLEEVEEKATEKPSNITQILLETAGVGSQQTSANSGNVTIRIEGLDGKYTQILKDGFPVYSGFFSGLSLMQVPPLDLRQVELIKGSSSSLYGSDAIAGIVNLISKQPKEKAEFTVLGNINHKHGGDLGIYYSQIYGKFGITFLSNNNIQEANDVNNDSFSDISKIRTYSVNPKFFYYADDKNTLSLALNSTFDERTGGYMPAIESMDAGKPEYFEQNKTQRLFYQLKYESKIEEEDYFLLKNSTSYFGRKIQIPGYLFDGSQVSSFTELSYLWSLPNHKFIPGISFSSENYYDNSNLDRNFNTQLIGLFFQDDWLINQDLLLQIGARADYQKLYKFSFVPRASIKYNFDKNLTGRFSIGSGYKKPSIFDSESEYIQFRNILSIADSVKPERSSSMNLDINYSTMAGDFQISLNQSFFYTDISNPLYLDSISNTPFFQYINYSGKLTTIGSESNIKIFYNMFNLNVAYTYTNANYDIPTGNMDLPFSPKHRVVISAQYEREKNYKVGIECFFIGEQSLGNGQFGRSYWLLGFVAEKTISNFMMILNCENLTDFRQSKYESIVLPPVDNPAFKQLYAPIDGILLNFMVKYSL